jgi:nitrite reductase/ring-hydroxylating ferredoxin subunit
MSSEIYVCAAQDVRIGAAVVVDLPRPGGRGPRRQAMVTRLPDSRLRAYLNLCKHLPVPLDAYRGNVMDAEGEHFLCRTHGAAYRLEDGLCTEGPCIDEALDAFEVVVREGAVYLIDPLDA